MGLLLGLDLVHRLRGQDEATACCVAHVPRVSVLVLLVYEFYR